MLNCKTGYVLRTGSGSECPQCTCQAVGVQPLRCTAALFCHRGCVLGYKHGDHGCPSCSCISPSGEVGSYNTISMLMKYCTNVAHCVNSCHGGFSLTGSEAGRCPACTCTIQHHSHQDIHRMCPETFRCGEMCADGFTLKNEPGNPCPACYCITGQIKVTASPQPIHPIQTGSHVMVDTGVTAGNVPMGIAGGGSGSLPLKAPSPSLTVPGTVPSVSIAAPPSSGVIGSGSQGVPSGSAVHFNILQGPGGENIGGPQVAADHVVTSSVKQTPPNRCARIIHCVLTCHSGYKLTDKDEGGCPGCDCLPSK
uniref:Uncharacterized protein n=1 Tax=Magallana gigas TaxID=29159 RepID=K1R5R8_MAGGI